MLGSHFAVPASEGAAFDCYVALPSSDQPTSAVVLACSIDGVDEDLRDIADVFAANGHIAVAPDLFWRTVPGSLPSGDPRAHSRSQPRLERLVENERDLVDTLSYLRTLPQWNNRGVVMGFCYGGPFAITGPKRLGFQAGVSCHGSQMLALIGDLAGVTQPVRIIWGDQDSVAPEPVLAAYRTAAVEMPNVEVHIFPGVEHGFMMPSSSAFDQPARDFSMQSTLDLLAELRGS